MNERIRELAEQAELEYNFDPMLWLKYEKFAELIIEECARLAAATPCPYVADDRMMQHIGHTWDMACHAAGKEIRENFKVK